MVVCRKMNKKKHFLSILAIFRNEEHVLDEFIQHHIKQGVDHFYLIDNDSDDSSREILKKYDSIVTIRDEKIFGNRDPDEEVKVIRAQYRGYNKFIPHINTKWLLPIDLDEFMYARNGYSTIKEYLKKNGKSVDQILVRPKQFTSGGLIKQPKSVIDGFTKRWDHDKFGVDLCKPIVRFSKLDIIKINYCYLKKNSITVDTNKSMQTEDFYVKENKEVVNMRSFLGYTTEEHVKNDYVRLTQFIQSDHITKDLNTINCIIQKLYARDTDLISFC